MDVPGLDELGRFTSRRELASLAPHLEEGETVHYALAGSFEGRIGLLAATNQRVLFATTGLIRDRLTSWTYQGMHQVTANVTLADASITMRAGDEAVEVTGCERRAARAFAETVAERSAKRAFRKVSVVEDRAVAQAQATSDMSASEKRLARLDAMHEKGSITDAEWRSNRELLLKELGLPEDLPPPRKAIGEKPDQKVPAAWPETAKDKALRAEREASRR